MRFNCCYCIFNTVKFETLMKHYRFVHGNNPNFRIVCGINGCAKNYSNVRTYRRHIRLKHELFWLEVTNADVINDNGVENDDQLPIEENHAIADDAVDIDVNREVSMFLLKLREIHKIPQAACTFVANECVDILKMSREKMTEDLHNVLQRTNTNIDVLKQSGLDNVLQESEFEHALHNFSTALNLQKYVANEFGVVKPCEYELGRDNVTAKVHTMQYIPILQTLKALLKFDDVFSEVINGHSSPDGDILGDFCDGVRFHDNELFSKQPNSLQIQLYCDDFTVANPLGTHVHLLKFCVLYFVLGNLPPMHRSKLRTIQSVILCPTIYVKKYGYESILQPLISDLKILEQNGIQILKDGIEYTFHGTVSFLVADNLAAHDLGGFQTHFNHGRICRFCNVIKADQKNHFRSDNLQLRTKEAYELQAVAVQTNPALFTLYGIKQSSCLNELQFFHVVEGSPPDIAHDLFEGVIPEVIAEVVKYCVTQQFFTLSDLNEQIKKFPYEGSDCTNKPSLMSDKIQTFKVKQTACQALCLCRLLPLMVGSFIPQDSKEWQVLLKLLDVVQYCMSKKVTRALTIFLADLIEEFLTMYFEAFPHVSMKPKAHYLVHYPEMLLQYGPLINTWTLRFEGKHNYFKEIARTSKNRKNVCKTLATRHEYMQATYHGSQNFLTEDALTHSKGDLYPVRLLPQTIQAQVLLLVGGNESVYSVGKVCYNGSFYSKGLAVAVEEGSFGKIDMCFLITDEVFLLCRMSERVQYISHVHAFNVCFGCKFVFKKCSDLFDSYPLGVYQTRNMELITLRHNFVL